MSLIITPSSSNLTIKDTTISIPSVFVRLGVFMPVSVNKMLVELSCYQNRESYDSNTGPVSINEISNGTAEYEISEGSQLLAAHELVKAQLEAAGYSVEIVDL